MLADVYGIQVVPSSNINRDDTGSPKTAVFGGVQRARVSSQAWKRAMRTMFADLLPEERLGVRTKLAVSRIAERIVELRPDYAADAEAMAEGVLTASGVKVKASTRKGETEGSKSTEYLVFIANSELSGLAELAVRWKDEGDDDKKTTAQKKKDVSKVFHGPQAIDIALFGRMLADAPDLNTDACSQVAHAISVDRVTQEYDYFTAVDDCASDDNAGAGMIGTVSYNSSTLYRYATVNVDELASLVGDADAAAEGVAAFVRAFACSMPTGKQNTFANRTLPNALVVSFREQQPVNAVSAFEVPVRPREDASISQQAIERLGAELGRIETAYDMPPKAAWCVLVDDVEAPVSFGERVTLEELVSSVRAQVVDYLGQREG